ncbi:hypothetical protein [Methylorubrum thiocyanatum]|uniref:hypothetical protein n=1 Tax=Methylorubrum thiocyanatum TaxID=47958 RepID=UPI00398C3DF5
MNRMIVIPCLAAACLTSSGPVRAGDYMRQPAALIHGNYCGMGNNAPLPPVDALDLACARHDACTPSGRMPSRACNLRLQRETEFLSRDPRQPDDLRALAGFISAGAALLPFDMNAPVIVTRMPASRQDGWHPPGSYRAAAYAY